MDFIKIIEDKRIVGVLNLNNMIPILDKNVKELKYKNIEEYIVCILFAKNRYNK